MLVRVKKNIVGSIGTLHYLAMRNIFDKPSMTIEDCRALEEGITAWSNKVELNASERWEITRIVNALIADEHGYFDRSKDIMKRENIHYKNFYKAGLPFVEVEGRKTWNKS